MNDEIGQRRIKGGVTFYFGRDRNKYMLKESRRFYGRHGLWVGLYNVNLIGFTTFVGN